MGKGATMGDEDPSGGMDQACTVSSTCGRNVMDQERNKTMSVAERPANARRSDREVI